MNFRKKTVSIVCAAALLWNVVALTGCVFDLGSFENEEAYYESFGTVSLTSLSGTRTYGLEEDFYNPPALEHFETHVPSDQYVTFSLPVEKAMDIDEIRFCVNASTDEALQIKMYIGTVAAPFYNDFDESGEISAAPTDFVAETTVFCEANEWGYFSFSDFPNGTGDGNTVAVDDGDVITFLFLNNTAWGKTLELRTCEFTLTALLIRAI